MRLTARSNIGMLGNAVIALVCVFAASVGHSQDVAMDGTRETGNRSDNWLPFVAAEVSIHVQEFRATGATTFGAVHGGTNTLSNLMFRAEAGVASPEIDIIPGHPRLALRGGISTPLRETSTVTSSQAVVDDLELGTELFVSWRSMWHAGIDLRFDLSIADHIVSIQPGIEYLGSRLRYEPSFTFRAQPGSDAAQQTPNPFNPPRIPFDGRSSPHVYHFVGPSLSIEVGMTKVKMITLSAFLSSRLYWLVGDRDIQVDFSQDLLGNLESGTGRLESNFLAGQVGFGIRGSF